MNTKDNSTQNISDQEKIVLTPSILDEPSSDSPSSLPSSSSKSSSVIKLIQQSWNNLSFRAKLTLLMLTSIIIPVIAVTQAIVSITEQHLLSNLEQNLKSDLRVLEAEIQDTEEEIAEEVTKLASIVGSSQLEISNPENYGAIGNLLADYTKTDNDESFYFITDAQGKTVAQKIQTIDRDFLEYFPSPQTGEKESATVSLPIGIDLGDIPMVRDVLQEQEPLSGMDLLEGRIWRRLGLLKQAKIDLKTPDGDLSEDSEDFQKGQKGLTIMAVAPIIVDGELVGTTVVGTLMNRYYEIIDQIQAETELSTITIFAQDWIISTNVSYRDQKARAIGARASQEVAETVLNKGADFIGQTNIIGLKYLIAYHPIFNYYKTFKPAQAQIIGMTSVGQSQEQISQSIRKIVLISYGIGGVVLVLASIVAIPSAAYVAGSLRNLAHFAQKVGGGEQGLRLKNTQRKDEIGILAQEMNRMVARIESSVQQERQQKEMLQEELLKFLDTIEDAAGGDLTVRAEMTSSEVAIVADFFNAIIENLQELITQVKQSANLVNSSVGVNEEEILHLVEKTLRQATQISQTLKAVENMNLSIQEVAQNAKSAAEVAKTAASMAETGEEAIDKTVNTIVQLRSTVIETGDKVKRLDESSERIFKAISLINQIALKTNLLAVNASIEAARAGEEGRGFAVVAEEIGKLANQSATATKEIEQILGNIQQETDEVLRVMEVGIAQVAKGTNQVSEAKQSLGQIFEVSGHIDQLVATISQAAVSQAETSQYVSNLMEKIANISENTADSSRQIAHSLEQTVEIVQKMQTSIGTFKVEEDE
ncbi:MAG: methyl-accepting chemotaxis protein [Xenococcaceae cyanobacterium MO_188.B29]|nr:methyl-accepting chemotaxis protein [Xenococcaceae cyanobacterium MO_188.B29]